MYNSENILEFLTTNNITFEFNNIYKTFKTYSTLDDSLHDSISWSKNANINIDKINSSILIVSTAFDIKYENMSIFKVKDPRRVFSKLLNHFFNEENTLLGISQNSNIEDDVSYQDDLYLGNYSTIGKGCSIGYNVKIFSNVTIYPNTIIGNNVIIHAGSVIGSPGFGYTRDENNKLEYFVQLGNVVIEDNVEVGANSCIDRATISSTIIGENTKISNFCQIAHNVIIGKNCLITGKVQIGGGSIVGDDVYFGPSAVIMNKLKIDNGADIKMGSIVVKNVLENESVSGNFAYNHQKRLRDFSISQRKNKQ